MIKEPRLLYGIQLYKNVSEDNLIYILAYIVDNCNYFCEYCYNKRPYSKKSLDLTVLYKYIMFIINNYPSKYIQLELIGGEPTLHKDLLQFCEQFKNYNNITIKIFTNLSAKLEIYKQLLNLNCILIASWHSLVNDKINNNYINNLNTLLDNYKNQIEVRIMYEPFNSDNALYVANKLINKSNHDIFDVTLLFNPNTEQSNLFLYSKEQKYKFYLFHEMNKIRTNRKEFYIEYTDNTSELKTFNDMFCNKTYSFKRWLCNAGKNSLFINYDGNVYPCVEYSYNINNILFNIYNNKYIFYKFKPIFCNVDYCTCDWDIRKKKIF